MLALPSKTSWRREISKTSFYRHQQEQQNGLPPGEREVGLRLCRSCTAFPNGHLTSRATYYRHLQRRQAPASSTLDSDQAALCEGDIDFLPSPGPLTSGVDSSDEEANGSDEDDEEGIDEEEGADERRLRNMLLVDDEEERELLFDTAGKPI